MNYSTSSLLVNDVWRTLLIVDSDTPIDYTNTDVIERRQDLGNSVCATRWYTDGLHRTIEQGSKYYYWFLVRSESTEITATNAETIGQLQDENSLLKAQIKAQTDRADFMDDCIAEMAAKVYV